MDTNSLKLTLFRLCTPRTGLRLLVAAVDAEDTSAGDTDDLIEAARLVILSLSRSIILTGSGERLVEFISLSETRRNDPTRLLRISFNNEFLGDANIEASFLLKSGRGRDSARPACIASSSNTLDPGTLAGAGAGAGGEVCLLTLAGAIATTRLDRKNG